MPSNWQDYTSQIDHILGSMSPEDRALVEKYSTMGDGTFADAEINGAVAALQKYGYSPQQARTLAEVARAVRKRGGQAVGEGFDPNKVFGQEPVAPGGGAGGDADPIRAQIQRFIDSMMGPVDPNDPTAQLIQRNAVNAAQAYAGRAGANARSTIGNSAVAANYNNGMQAYDMQRKALGQQGLSLLNAHDLGVGQLQFGYDQMKAGQAEAQWAAGKNQSQALGSAIGLGLGTVAGAYFNMPQLGNVGSQLGGGLGGMAYGSGGPSYGSLPNYTSAAGGYASGGRGGLRGTGY